MIRHLSRLGGLVIVSLALTVTGLTVGTGALASTVGPTRVGPHQYFAGEVNGRIENATVKVVCPGPGGSVGRALSGQTVAVTSPLVIASNFGYTGSAGRRILAIVGPAASAAQTIIFRYYDKPKAFPTNVPVPCSGTGVLIFIPLPGSSGAHAATVTVTYANVAASG
jgi:hypothetical protein